MGDMRTTDYMTLIAELGSMIDSADAVVVGAGAGLSTAAGLTYSGERFRRNFADFIARYGFADMYSAGFFPFPTAEERWAYWSRHIWFNRYVRPPKDTYAKLLRLLGSKDFFVLTTNGFQGSVCSIRKATMACCSVAPHVMPGHMATTRL